jgi:uncharacterized protein (DUF305 family)
VVLDTMRAEVARLEAGRHPVNPDRSDTLAGAVTERRVRWTLAVLIAVCAAAVATACAGRSGTETGPAPGSTDELEAIYRARTDSARMRFTEADVRFMTGMIVHHAQAVVMSRLAPTHGASPSIRTLAARIINAQRDEIALMQRWLQARGHKAPEVGHDGTVESVPGDPAGHAAGHAGHAADADDHDVGHQQEGADASMRMPGMLTPTQMRELEGATGAEFDRLFLTYMIQHHQGAVDMVRDLFATDGAAQGEMTFRLASGIHVDQVTEIERMKLMLETMFDGPDG